MSTSIQSMCAVILKRSEHGRSSTKYRRRCLQTSWSRQRRAIESTIKFRDRAGNSRSVNIISAVTALLGPREIIPDVPVRLSMYSFGWPCCYRLGAYSRGLPRPMQIAKYHPDQKSYFPYWVNLRSPARETVGLD
jgi:hypothetical protein